VFEGVGVDAPSFVDEVDAIAARTPNVEAEPEPVGLFLLEGNRRDPSALEEDSSEPDRFVYFGVKDDFRPPDGLDGPP